MKAVRVKQLVLGEGAPAVCVPLMAADEAELEEALPVLERSPFDLLEWRADFWRTGFLMPDGKIDTALLKRLTDRIRTCLGERPLLFTFRTSREGGNSDLPYDAWKTLLYQAAVTGAELVDMELKTAGEEALAVTDCLRSAGAAVIASAHDFAKTPSADEMVTLLTKMQECGADLSKLAVMPRSDKDVLSVLDVCIRMKHGLADRPYIIISMGQAGMLTRIGCAFTGSALTFASALGASAPGQIPADLMRQVLSQAGPRMDI